MFSKLGWLVCAFVLGLSTACTEKEIPRKNRGLDDSSNRQEFVENKSDERLDYSIQYGEEFDAIESLIEEGSVESLKAAYVTLNEKLYGAASGVKAYYSSSEYAGYLDNYVKLYKAMARSGVTELDTLVIKIRGRFKNHFISSCLRQEQCELLETALRRQSHSAYLVVEIAKNTTDNLEKLAILGFAYDVQGANRRRNIELEYLYFRTGSLLLMQDKADMKKKSKELILSNLKIIAKSHYWAEWSETNEKLYFLVRPWEYSMGSTKEFDDIQRVLLKHLPVYLQNSDKIRLVVERKVRDLALEASSLVDLSVFPAFSDIDVKAQFSDGDNLLNYIVLSLYFQNISLESANSLMNRLKPEAVVRAFEKVKTLVRWDVARLSIDSTKKLKEKFFEQEVKTQESYQDTLDYSRSLIPDWTALHTTRVWAAKEFLHAHVGKTNALSNADTDKFFNAIKRNILKNTVYPNMIAFAYYLAKTEWSMKFKILWFSFEIDASDVMDYMITGQYKFPWFNFVDLQVGEQSRVTTKSVLYRSEMFDAIYYFFATRTNEVYGINPDEFFEEIGNAVYKKRRDMFEGTLYSQNLMYINGNSIATQYKAWCKGIVDGKPIKELIPFYALKEYVSVGSYLTRDYLSAGVTQRPYFFNDSYRHDLRIRHQSNVTVIDRYRLELIPIINTLTRHMDIYDRFRSANSQLNLPKLNKGRKLVGGMDFMKKKFLGFQKHLGEESLDCPMVSHNEAKRRVRETAWAHYSYFKDIVHPIMTKVKSGELSISEANLYIRQLHEDHPAFLDEIKMVNDGIIYYVVSDPGFFLRTRLILTEGMSFVKNGFNLVNIEPVVGDHLKIPIPTNAHKDLSTKNPYMGLGGQHLFKNKFNYNEDAEAFAFHYVRNNLDNPRLTWNNSDHVTRWEMVDLNSYVDLDVMSGMIQYQVQMLQLDGEEYIDVSKEKCLVAEAVAVPEDCIKTHKADFSELAKTISKMYETFLLTEEDEDYLHLAGLRGFFSDAQMDWLLKYDPALYPDRSYKTLPFLEFAGLFDFAYQMLKSDYLGRSFVGYFESDADLKTERHGEGGLDRSCSGSRLGCYWKDEYVIADEFYYARKTRAPMIFNFDLQIVSEDYKAVKKGILGKFSRLQILEAEGEEIIAPHFDLNRWVRADIHKEKEQIRVLSINHRTVKDDMREVLEEGTQRLYLEEQDWSDYILK